MQYKAECGLSVFLLGMGMLFIQILRARAEEAMDTDARRPIRGKETERDVSGPASSLTSRGWYMLLLLLLRLSLRLMGIESASKSACSRRVMCLFLWRTN